MKLLFLENHFAQNDLLKSYKKMFQLTRHFPAYIMFAWKEIFQDEKILIIHLDFIFFN